MKAKRTPDEVREAKRAHMARKRSENPEAMRERQRKWASVNRDRINAARREWDTGRFFYARARRLKNVTPQDLAAIWKKQRGRCALTGEKLDRTAELDHDLPRSRGGTDALANLQWTTHAANRAKRDLTTPEFLVLCQSCARWIGQRIQAVEAITNKQLEAA